MEAEREPGPRTRRLELLALAAIAAIALWLRVADITAFRIGPDEGNYLNSARIHALERGGSPIAWLQGDVAWAAELKRVYADENAAYQHSYLHQLAARWLYRMGCGALVSLRLSSAISGTLTVLFVAWLVRELMPRRRWLAVLAAAFAALTPYFAFLARTGWGQTGEACWYLAFLVFARRALVAQPEPTGRQLVRCALGMIASSLLAFGWHEGVAPYVAGTALVALLAPWIRGERWTLASVWRSRRTWTYVAGASVIGALTLTLLFSPFAQKYWFAPKGRAQGEASLSWLDVKRLSLENLFVQQRPDLQLTWVLLALAFLGALWLRRVDRTAFRWLVANALAGPVLILLFFGDAWLLRAYVPSLVLLSVPAACGVAWIGERFGHAAGAALGALALALIAATTWSSLFGRHGGPLFVQKLYDQVNDLEHRHVDEALYDLLAREIRPEDRVIVFADKAAIYRLLDRGIRAREEYLDGPRASWPRWIVGVPAVFETSPHFEANGGPFRLRVRDGVGRHALYERRD